MNESNFQKCKNPFFILHLETSSLKVCEIDSTTISLAIQKPQICLVSCHKNLVCLLSKGQMVIDLYFGNALIKDF